MTKNEGLPHNGVTGQDGAHLADFLLRNGYEVHGIKRRASSFNTALVDHLYRAPFLQRLRPRRCLW